MAVRHNASKLLKALIRYSRRWKQIRFILPRDQFETLSSLSSGGSSDTGKGDCPMHNPHLKYSAAAPSLRHAPSSFLGTWMRLRHHHAAWNILRHLCVRSTGHGATHFFETLILPDLRRLEYSGQPELHFLPLLTSAHSVECLILNSMALTTALLDVLRLTPILEELTLFDEPSIDPGNPWRVPDGQLIPLLTPQAESDSTVICPRLQRIKLMECSALSDTALLDFILARTSPRFIGVAPLSEIRVRFARKIQVDIMPSLQPLLAAGLAISVEYQPDTYMPQYSPSETVVEAFD
ncbi:hypothetical protein C8J57DRAFT_1224435 [Mycena rebaudengoi]|nr:hypothetical protein C8J57DRAFT_1224435 [Mycena rebaudengoi]